MQGNSRATIGSHAGRRMGKRGCFLKASIPVTNKNAGGPFAAPGQATFLVDVKRLAGRPQRKEEMC